MVCYLRCLFLRKEFADGHAKVKLTFSSNLTWVPLDHLRAVSICCHQQEAARMLSNNYPVRSIAIRVMHLKIEAKSPTLFAVPMSVRISHLNSLCQVLVLYHLLDASFLLHVRVKRDTLMRVTVMIVILMIEIYKVADWVKYIIVQLTRVYQL